MTWFYFKRLGNNLVPLSPQEKYLPPRPEGANPDNGDLLTPWFETEDHFDEEHVHVRAKDLEAARRKANSLLKRA